MKRGTKSIRLKNLEKDDFKFSNVFFERKLLQESFLLIMKWTGLPLGKNVGLVLKFPLWKVNFASPLGGTQGLQLQWQPLKDIKEMKLYCTCLMLSSMIPSTCLKAISEPDILKTEFHRYTSCPCWSCKFYLYTETQQKSKIVHIVLVLHWSTCNK